MADIQEKNCEQIISFIQRQSWPWSEKEEKSSKRIDVNHGKYSCVVKVYSNGTVQIQGAESELKNCFL